LLWYHCPLIEAISAAARRKISEASAQCLGNIAWSLSTLAFIDEPLLDAISSSSLRTCSQMHPQGMSNILWSLAGLGWKDFPLRDAIAASAIRKISAYEEQDLSCMAWSMDVLEGGVALSTVLPVAIPRFLALASGAKAISWVDFATAGTYWAESADSNEQLQLGLQNKVMEPTFQILQDLVLHKTAHSKAIRTLQEYVPSRLLPHLGVPHTRSALGRFGVALHNTGARYPTAAIREECWLIGVEGAI